MTATSASERDHALYAEAARLHVAARVLARLLQLLAKNGPSRNRDIRAAYVASVAADGFVWRLLRHRRTPLWLRVLFDTIDVAVWAAFPEIDLQTSLAAQIAVELESGMRWGVWGACVPALHAAVSTAMRKIRRTNPDVSAHVSHLGAVVAGSSIRWVEDRRLADVRAQHDAELSAKRVRAFLAGQQSVAMGASSVVDLLTPIAMILGATGEDAALAQVRAGWKSDLAAQAHEHALYLDEAIRLWEHRHNDHPDLTSFVVASVHEGDGTELLTSFQARTLIDLLDRLNLRGEVRVRVAEPRRTIDRRPGRRFALVVNGLPVEVPADPSVRVADFDVGPPVMLFAACASMMPIRQRDGGVPVRVATATAALWLAGAWVSLRRPTEHTARRELTTATVLAAVQGAAYARTARWPRRANGVNCFHGTYGITPLLLLLDGNAHRESEGERRATIAALVGILAGAYVLAPRPRAFADYVTAVAWPTAALLGSSGVRAATEREADHVVERLEAADDAAERAAFVEGRRTVLALVEKAVAEADVAAARASLDAEELTELHTRLDEVRRVAAGFANA